MYNSFYSSPYGPGQGQGQQPSQQQQQPPQQMPAYTGLAPPLQQYGQQQPPPSAGSGMSFLAPQPTGFPVAPQPTGFQPPQQQQQQRGLAPAPTGFGAPPMGPPAQSLTPQYTVVPHQQPQLQPQPTAFAPPPSAPPSAGGAVAGGPAGGQTSSDIARSFTGTPAQPAPSPSQSKRAAIPQQRLSFITAADQTKFEQLFRSAVGDGQALEGEKAKELLLRSRLPGSDLAKIWVLADTTKSGRLLFPEFALAMYLCNLRLTNRDLPAKLPERIANEVSGMVDIISFNVPDTAPSAPPRPTNVPEFNATPTTAPSNAALLSTLAPQPTGMPGMQPQATGFYGQQQQPPNIPSIMAPQQTGFPGANANQPSGLRSQQTGFMNPQQTGFPGAGAGGNVPPVPPIPSSFTGAPGLTAQPTGLAPLTSQPTGMPGQWGFVNAPASGLPNIEALKQQLMPQPGREGGYTTQGLSGNATVPWAVTKDEKRIYDDLFRAWDGFNKGYIGGDVAIEIMGQSGLPREDLERIWTLSDPNNRGKLNKDEFAVAMHLIYRRLNGYPVPNRLPPELVPPSTRHLNESIGQVKSLLSQDAEGRKSSGAFLQPQKTGVSYLKDHSFRGTGSSMPAHWGRKDATMFKNDDDAVPYRSSARRRAGGRSPSPNMEAQQQSRAVHVDEMSVEQLKKKIRETKIMLDAADFQDENAAEDDEAMNRRDRREAESIMERIRRVQENIDTDPKASLRNTDSSAEKRALRRQLQNIQDQLPQLASDVRKTEKLISETKLEIFRLKDAKVHPNSLSIVGTGPGGTITESDRIKARARARMQARAAELAGKPAPTIEDEGDAQRRIDEESVSINAERERNEGMTRDVEDSVKEFSRALEDGLKDVSESSTKEHERRRWEEALGVEDEIRDFIYDLQRSSRMARTPAPTSGYERDRAPSYSSSSRPSAYESPARSMTSTPTSTGASPSPQDRVLSAKERAQKRIQERMAAAGLRSGADAGETLLQRQERERKEREERLRRAEEEDRKREEERQRRLVNEGSVVSPPPQQEAAPVTSPIPKKAAPPPPPQKRDDRGREQREAEQAAIRAEQSVQEAERERLEAGAREQEEEIAREREAAEARLKVLEEQVKQGKLRKQEEKRRKQQAAQEAKEKEERLAKQKREIEEAAERERKLREQLERLDVSSSDDEDEWGETKQVQEPEPAPAAAAPEPPKVPSPPPVPRAPSPPAIKEPSPEPEPELTPTPTPAPPPVPAPAPVSEAESKNPFFRHTQPTAPAPAAAEPASQPQLASTNPFHNLSRNESAAPRSRVEPSDDDWSNAGSDEESEDEDDHPGGGSAKQLASLLFNTMGPPRPLSAMEGDKTPTPTHATPPPVPAVSSPPPAADVPGAFPEPDAQEETSYAAPEAPTGAPPPPPPMPPFGAPAAPPPPPPPPPGGAPAPRPAMPTGAGRGALLADIQAGKGLRKVQTKDMSQASVAGRVLD